MKFSFIKNDTGTFKDEIILSLITAAVFAAGVLLIVFRPAFWIVSESVSITTGVLFVLLAVMYIPCIIYRLTENRHKSCNKTNEKW